LSLSDDVEEIAVSAAKKFDHGELQQLHVLFALKKILGERLPELSISELEENLLKIRSSSSNTISISEDAKAKIKSINSYDDGISVAKDIAISHLNIEIDLQRDKPEASVATQEAKKSEIKPLSELLSRMNSLVGLQDVKQSIGSLINTHQANNVRMNQGMTKIPVGLHCVFTGSPGTGKTTVARSVADMYNAIGLLPTNKVVEVDRASLVAGYVGQTAIRVQEVINQAIGGVLFIDEAYSLSADSGAGFGDEAISTLVKAMEDHRENLAVIVAGYKDPMKSFIESNQGLKSRFQNVIHFPDYTQAELTQIFTNLCSANDMTISEAGLQKLNKYLADVNPIGEHGNARFIRNLFEKMFANLSNRAASDGNIEIDELKEFTDLDVPTAEARKTPLGFGPAQT
jgi:SpoVK/Ycf46/Vps4 family AAA+-type ATPase